MPMTMTQKILAAHCGKETLTAGEMILANTDLVLGNDITSPVAINEFDRPCRRLHGQRIVPAQELETEPALA